MLREDARRHKGGSTTCEEGVLASRCRGTSRYDPWGGRGGRVMEDGPAEGQERVVIGGPRE